MSSKKENRNKFGNSAMMYVAWISKSPNYFDEFGVKFWDTTDNLDYALLAFFSLGDDLTFMLSHHKRNPVPNVIGIEMAHQSSYEDVKYVTDAIKSHFKLGADEIVITAKSSQV